MINKEPNKDEAKLTKADWKKAAKRRKEPIKFLEIIDANGKMVYASASRVTHSDGVVRYTIKIDDQSPENSKMFFKSMLFMILWIYQ